MKKGIILTLSVFLSVLFLMGTTGFRSNTKKPSNLSAYFFVKLPLYTHPQDNYRVIMSRTIYVSCDDNSYSDIMLNIQKAFSDKEKQRYNGNTYWEHATVWGPYNTEEMANEKRNEMLSQLRNDYNESVLVDSDFGYSCN